jgi:hypothetical protein
MFYGQQQVQDMATDLGDGWSKAVVTLEIGDSAWAPGSSKKVLVGHGRIVYMIHPSSATAQPEPDSSVRAVPAPR